MLREEINGMIYTAPLETEKAGKGGKNKNTRNEEKTVANMEDINPMI